MTERYRCADDARQRAEPCYGTASQVRRWLLLEQPGPWGRDALRESRIPPPLADRLGRHADAVRARLILIRRSGGRAGATRSCFVVRSDQAAMERLVLDDAADLLDVDLGPLTNGAAVGGEPVTGAVHLVCTNGRHDACCAEFGQPLARALSETAGERVWECSHIGGDRFAGNLVCFPHGLYFGHVGARDGPAVAARYERGGIDLAHYRGRSCHPFAVQAAEYFLRVAEGLDHVDDLAYRGRTEPARGTLRVAFTDGRGAERTVEVGVAPDPVPRRLTCRADADSRPSRYELLAIDGRPVPGAP